MTAEELLEETLKRLAEAVHHNRLDRQVAEEAHSVLNWLETQMWRLKYGVGAAK